MSSVPNIPCLKTLCLNSVVAEIWRNTGLVDSLAKLSEIFVKIDNFWVKRCNTYYEKLEEAKKPFYALFEDTLQQIKALENVPAKLKNQIVMTLMKLEADISEFVIDLLGLFYEKEKNINIGYCIHKMCIDCDSELDRTETILQILHDSYMQVNFRWSSMPKYCCIPSNVLHSFIYCLDVCDGKRKWEKYRKIIADASGIEVLQLWKEEAIMGRNSDEFLSPSKAQLFEHMAVHAPLQVLKYFCRRLKKCNRPKIIPSALVWILLSDKETPEKIVFLVSKVSQRNWYIILSRYHEYIFRKLFLTYYSDYCVKFFGQLCKLKKLEICMQVLLQAIRMLSNPGAGCKYDCVSIVYENSRQTFLGMWHTAPESIKADLGTDFHLYMDCILERKDFDLLDILISDRAFNTRQKNNYAVHVAAKLLLEDNLTKLEESSKEYLQFVQKNIDLEMLKCILATPTKAAPCYDALSALLQTSQEINMKQDVTEDREFMTNALTVRLLVTQEMKENHVTTFLQWCFNAEENKIEEFTQKKLLSDLWLVDVYKKYLLETSSKQVKPTETLFDMFNVEEGAKIKIKEIVRQDSELISKLFANFTVRDFCDVSVLLECLGTGTSYMLEYLLSDDGFLRMCELINSDFYNEDLYNRNRLFKTIEHYTELAENWFNSLHSDSKTLLQEKKMADVWKYAQQRNVAPLLSSESYEQNKLIVEANYRIAAKLVEFPLVIYRNLAYIENGITESLTDFSIWLLNR